MRDKKPAGDVLNFAETQELLRRHHRDETQIEGHHSNTQASLLVFPRMEQPFAIILHCLLRARLTMFHNFQSL
jgi:hypothetical protein